MSCLAIFGISFFYLVMFAVASFIFLILFHRGSLLGFTKNIANQYGKEMEFLRIVLAGLLGMIWPLSLFSLGIYWLLIKLNEVAKSTSGVKE